MPASGSLGMFGYTYRLEADAVTLARKTWIAAAGVPLVGVALWRAPSVFGHYAKVDFAVQFLLPLVAGLAMVIAGLAPPWKIVVTREGLRWGAATIVAGEVRAVELGIDPQQFWQIVIETPAGPRKVRLGRVKSTDIPAEVVAILDGMRDKLGVGQPFAA